MEECEKDVVYSLFYKPQTDQDLSLEERVDELNNQLLIPNYKTNYHYSSTDFEIYLGGFSARGGLMISGFNRKETWPYFIKFTKDNIPIPLQNEEYVEFIKCGLQHLVIATNFSKCYLFGDFKYIIDNFDLNLCQPLLFKVSYTPNHLNYKITHLDCGEQFIIVKDELNNFWYAGKSNFGNSRKVYYYDFTLLNGGILLSDLNSNKHYIITKVIAGGRHVAVCVNDQFIYTIGNNYSNQLGIRDYRKTLSKKSNLCDFSFMKADWNLNGEYYVQELACSGSSTIILTKCGKIFKTNEDQELLTLITDIVDQPISIGTEWEGAVILLQSQKLHLLLDDEIKVKDSTGILLENTNLQELKLSTGTGSMKEMFACYSDKEVKFKKKEETITLKTKLPIMHVQLSSEIYLVFCKKNRNEVQRKLFNTKGLVDIDFILNK
ncbi:hypothetical protein ABK040_006298 [Willaertia magna]